MAILTLRNLTMGYGGPPLLDRVNLQVEKGDRICLLGRNGEGKSTLLQLINHELEPDDGEVEHRQEIVTARLPQEVPQGLSGSVLTVVAGGLSTAGFGKGEEEAGPEWQERRSIARAISLMSLDPDGSFDAFSAGMKRRVLLARALARDPDILLLDEPTNHLDMDAIRGMEEFLERFEQTLIFVTHDRVFLKKLATRIIDLDRGRLTSWSCGYDTYLKRKQALLDEEAKQWVLLDRNLTREEAWVREGIKARRTRNEGRVRALMRLRDQRRDRRDRIGSARIKVQEAERSGRLVIEAERVSFDYGGPPVIRDFTTLLMRGDRVGIIGPNGSGKTTLLRVLLGSLHAREGRVRHGTRLEVAYFDQLRGQLDEDQTVQDNVTGGSLSVTVEGKSRHIIGYLQDFLFTPDRARSPVRFLSGGERNRLLLARLFARPSNVLVLDEPTNDLDAETLELLEDRLLGYGGTVLLVTHDRAFLNNVVTSILSFEGEGSINEYAGGYDDWFAHHKNAAAGEKTRSPRGAKGSASANRTGGVKHPGSAKHSSGAKHPGSAKHPGRKERPPRLTYKEKGELEALPLRIDALEGEIKDLQAVMADPAFYRRDGDKIAEVKTRLDALEKELKEAYKRWEILEAKKG